MNEDTLFNGYKLILDNAQKLQKEAALLKENGFIERAYTLYQLSIEEVGKSLIIYKSLLDLFMGTKIDATYINNLGFKKHQDKTLESLKAELLAIGMFESHIGRETDLRNSIIEDHKNIQEIDNKKNLSLYVSFDGNKFISPETSITEKMLDEIERKAIIRFRAVADLNHSKDRIKTTAVELQKIMSDPEKLKILEEKVEELYGN